MRNFNILFRCMALLAGTATFGACSENEQQTELTEDRVAISVHMASDAVGESRAATTPAEAYAPESGTLFLYYGAISSDESSSALYECQNGQWNSKSNPIFWNDLTAINGKYPFFASAPSAPMTGVKDNQSKEEDYLTSDQLIAYTTNSERRTEVNLAFRHILAQLCIKLSSGVPASDPDYIDPSNATVSITGAWQGYKLAYTGTHPNGTCPSPEVPAIATVTTNGTSATPITPLKKAGNYYAVLPPQTWSTGELKMTFTIDGLTYTWKNTDELTTTAGTSRLITLSVKKSDLQLKTDGITLTPWDESPATVKGQLDITVSGTPDSPEAGTSPADFTRMSLWKNSDASAPQDPMSPQQHTYDKVDNAWTFNSAASTSGTSPFYLDDIKDTDRFYATAKNTDGTPQNAPILDTATQLNDLLGAGPGEMKGGQLVLNFRHLMSQLSFVLTRGSGFPTDISLEGALITTPMMSKQHNVVYSPDGTLVAVAKTADQGGTSGTYSDLSTGATHPYLLVPQTIAASSNFTLTLANGKQYTVKTTNAITLKGGQHTVLTITLLSTGMSLGAISVVSWTTADQTGESTLDGVTITADALNDIDEEGQFYLAAHSVSAPTNVAASGTYPLVRKSGTTTIDKAPANGYTPIVWDALSKENHTYTALFSPSIFRDGAESKDNHEYDYLIASSAPTAWGTQPDFGTTTKLTHAMGRLDISLTADADASITNAQLLAATVTTERSTKANTNTSEAKLSSTSVAPETVNLLRPASETDAKFRALIYPQTLTTVVVTIDGKTYTLTDSIALKAGTATQLSLKLKRSTVGLTLSVIDWATESLDEKEVDVD